MKWLDKLLGRAPRQSMPAAAPAEAEDAPAASEGQAAVPQERRAEPDPEALAAAANPPGRVGLDLDRLKELPSSDYQPLTEYLTYIQVKRGETQSLIFVRQRDLDALAAMTGESKENFVKEFKRLGVLLSMN